MTLDEHLTQWTLDMRAQSFSGRTINERVRIVRQFGRSIDTDVLAVQPDAITSFLVNDDLKASSRDTYFRALTAWFTWAQGRRIIIASPMERVARPHLPPTSPRPAPVIHVERVLTSDIREATRMKILLGVYAGLRAHEIARFQGEFLDIQAQIMTIPGKGGRIDTLPVHPSILSEAQFFPQRGYWFPSPKYPDRPVRADSVSTVISHAFARLDTSVTAHQLRHTFATELLRKGVDVRIVQTLMRHESLATTARYTRVDIDQQRAALKTLNPAPTPLAIL